MVDEPPVGEPEGKGPGGLSRQDVASWLEGPAAVRPEVFGYPGERLGLPHHGRGSVATWGRRLAAIWIDWACAFLIAQAVHGHLEHSLSESSVQLLIFGTEVFLLTSLMGASFGQRLLRLRVTRIDGSRLGPTAVLVRTLLLCLAIPALIWDRDRRGLHDKAARSVVVIA